MRKRLFNRKYHHTTALIRSVSIIFLFLLTATCRAQREYSSSVKRAIDSYEEAVKKYDERKNTKALEEIDNSIKADPKFIEAHLFKGHIHSDMKQQVEAINSYKAAIDINPDFFPNVFYLIAEEEYIIAKYYDAKMHLEKYLAHPKAKGSLVKRARQLLQNSEFAAEAVNNPVPFTPVNMGDSINSADQEYFPTITADGQTFLFTRRMKSTTPRGNTQQEDFYISSKGSKGWRNSIAVSELNTEGNEGAAALSADGQYIFFTACEEVFDDVTAKKTKGSCDIFLSKKTGNKFSEPRNLPEPVNSKTWESQPSFSSDGRTLYFVRRISGAGNIGQSDIMMTRVGDDYKWSDPVSVSDSINTPDDEMSVFVHPDDQTLYFSSNGHPGMGGMDIFMSRRDTAGNWTKPVNLGYPINTIRNEDSFLVSPDGEKAFFSSDREGGKGGLDIYEFQLHEKVRPKPVTYMKGKVYDSDTRKALPASFELIDLATGKIVVTSTANAGNGEFTVALPTGKSYALNVSMDGYLFYSDNFQLKDPKSSKDPFIKDVPLHSTKTGESIILNNVFYETDKFDLKNESRIELGKLITFLNKNPKIKFEISGHTDNVGTKQYNQVLSEKRAKSVYDFLVSNGITSSRMTYKGYGDSKPVAENNTEYGKSKNRRTEFMISSVEQ